MISKWEIITFILFLLLDVKTVFVPTRIQNLIADFNELTLTIADVNFADSSGTTFSLQADLSETSIT